MAIYFYRVDEEYGCFSNFASYGVDLDDRWWPTVEHYFQAQKFAGLPFEEAVRTAETPMRAAQLGRDRTKPLRQDWEEVKDEVMLRALQRKFALHQLPRTLLLRTGNEEIVENSPTDSYWGCGSDGQGMNMLGKLLVKVRSQLASE